MTQQTLIDTAERLYPIEYTGRMFMPTRDELNNSYKRIAFIEGAKWQENKILEELEIHIFNNEHDWNRSPQVQFKSFIESLKNK